MIVSTALIVYDINSIYNKRLLGGFYGELEEECHSFFKQSSHFAVWIFTCAVCDHVAHHADNRVWYDDDIVHCLRIHTDVPSITDRRCMGRPL